MAYAEIVHFITMAGEGLAAVDDRKVYSTFAAKLYPIFVTSVRERRGSIVLRALQYVCIYEFLFLSNSSFQPASFASVIRAADDVSAFPYDVPAEAQFVDETVSILGDTRST